MTGNYLLRFHAGGLPPAFSFCVLHLAGAGYGAHRTRNAHMGNKLAGLALAIAVVLSTGCSKPAEKTAANAPASGASTAAAAANAAVEEPAAQTHSDEPLAWMAGSWCGKDEDQVLEETWMPSAGG